MAVYMLAESIVERCRKQLGSTFLMKI